MILATINQRYNKIKIKLIVVLSFFFCSFFNFSSTCTEQDFQLRQEIEEAIHRGATWLLQQQRSDGSWPIVTKDSHPSLVATGLYGLKTIEILLTIPKEDKEFNQLMYQQQELAISFLLAHQNPRGYWPVLGKIPWNEVEVTTAVLLGLTSAHYQGKEIEKAWQWLINQQEENGSWNNDCWDTIWATNLLLDQYYPTEEEVIQKACNWLIRDQKSKGYWKTNLPHLKVFGSLWTTQPALFTLAKTGNYQETIIKGLSYLKKEQNRSGSFGRWDASKTGLALYTFTSLEQYPSLMAEYRECAHKAVGWFLLKQHDKGTWPGGFHPFDIVDTSFALWGLTKFLTLFLTGSQEVN